MASESKRLLYKGPLLPAKRAPWSESYTQVPASNGQVPVKDGKNDKTAGKWVREIQFAVAHI